MKDPIKIIKLHEKIYLTKTEKQTGLSDEIIIETSQKAIEMLNYLKVIRHDKENTQSYLKNLAEEYNGVYPILLLETWLLLSIKDNDTYLYAYNYLAQKSNRYEGVVLNEVKLISDLDLYEMLDQESILQTNTTPKDDERQKKNTETLFDIWVDCVDKQRTYDNIINKLKQQNTYSDCAFITEDRGKLVWNESIWGNRRYLAAFIYTLTKGKWITKWYSASRYKRILENTFEFEKGFKPEPFKSLESQPFDDKYLAPFKGFPLNV